jgi:hypothetical protein
MDTVPQTHCFSKNLVALGIEPGLLDVQPGTLTTRPQRRSNFHLAALKMEVEDDLWKTIEIHTFQLF